MTADQNTFASVAEGLKTTAAAAAFVEQVTAEDLPSEAVRIGTRCVLDGVGLYVAGSEEHSVELLIAEAEHVGGREESPVLARRTTKVSYPMAARVLGTAGPE